MLHLETKFIAYLGYIVIATYTILIYKWLLIIEQIPVIYLTLFQFIITSIGLVICERFNKIHIIYIHPSLIIVPSLLLCCFVYFMHLSLLNNSSVTYQLSKIILTPIIVVLQTCFCKIKQSVSINISLLCILSGAGITFYYDGNLTTEGVLLLITTLFFTIPFTLIVKLKETEFLTNKLQFLFYYAPISTIALIIYILIFESPTAFLNAGWTYLQMYFIFAACMFAFINILVTNWIISNTSSLVYTTLVQIKLVLVLGISYLLFEEELNVNQFVGLGLTVSGCFVYNYLKDKNKNKYKIIYSYPPGKKNEC